MSIDCLTFIPREARREARREAPSEVSLQSLRARSVCPARGPWVDPSELQSSSAYLYLKISVRSQDVETLLRALWFSCDAEQDWNQFAFPLSIRCQGKKNGAVQLEVGSDLLLYIFRSLQPIINLIFGVFLCDTQKVSR